MNTRMKILLTILLVVIVAGPAYPEDRALLQLQSDVINLTQQVKQIQATMDKNNSTIQSLVEKMADQVAALSSGLQKISQNVDGVKGQSDSGIKEMRTILTNLNTAVTDLQADMSAVRDKVNGFSQQLNAMKSTAEPLAKPTDLWRQATVDYLAGNYDLALGDLQDFLSKFPTDDKAPDAHLMMAETLAAQKKYDQALNEYDIVLQKYADSDKSKTALLHKGVALAEANQVPQAITTFKEVVQKYPNTTEANDAALKLKDLQRPAAKAPAPRQGAAK